MHRSNDKVSIGLKRLLKATARYCTHAVPLHIILAAGTNLLSRGLLSDSKRVPPARASETAALVEHGR